MISAIPGVLDDDALARCRRPLGDAAEYDGATGLGRRYLLPMDVAAVLAGIVVAGVAASHRFIAAALPARLSVPQFMRAGAGDRHEAGADMGEAAFDADGVRIRRDLSAVLFLDDPDATDGGEIVVEGLYGRHGAKLAAGDLLLFPPTALIGTRPIGRGERSVALLSIQSTIRDDGARATLFELDDSVRTIADEGRGKAADVARLERTYHRLARLWAES